ncbi:hypothetical protein ACFV0C_02020 [Streptomyces sp. NPDC059568]|uniref:hypothetical protein n=1 Tax=Streptomyces sp. NPDC059568 TaxID=3346868 RepID=UPI0036C0C2D7
MADALSDGPSDEEIHEAIARRRGWAHAFRTVRTALGTRTAVPPPAKAPAKGHARIERHQVVRFEIVRSVETRTEDSKDSERNGSFDLSDRPRYKNLTEYAVEPPEDPRTRLDLPLVRLGSEREIICGCDGGRIICPECSGEKRRPCPPAVVCPDCAGVVPCTHCEETGKRRRRAGAKQPPVRRTSGQQTAGQRTAAQQGSTAQQRPVGPDAAGTRIACAFCKQPDVACAGCEGWGEIRCDLCGGKGRAACKECKASGRITHEQCGGEGSVTRWRAARIQQTPHRDSLELPERDWPARVRARLNRDAVWEPLDTGQGEKVPDGVDRVHRARITQRLAHQPHEIKRDVSVRTLRLARVELVNDPHRVFYVFPGKTEPQVVRLPSRQWVQRASGIAAGVVALLVLVLVLLN